MHISLVCVQTWVGRTFTKSLLQVGSLGVSEISYLCLHSPAPFVVFCFGFLVDDHRPKGFEGEAPPAITASAFLRMGFAPRKLCARLCSSNFANLGDGAPEGTWNLLYVVQKFVSRCLKLLSLFFCDSQWQGGRQPSTFLPAAVDCSSLSRSRAGQGNSPFFSPLAWPLEITVVPLSGGPLLPLHISWFR